MTVHRKNSQKTRKSKIILPLQTDTTLLNKNKKTTKNRTKREKNKTDIYKKIKYNNKANSLKIKNILANQYKVHTLLV